MELGPPLNAPSDLIPMELRRQVSKEYMSASQSGSGSSPSMVNVLMIGTGEYTTGFVNGTASDSDKSAGVVALTMFDLRARNKVNRLGMVGVNGCKFPSIRKHMQHLIADAYGLDISVDTFPADDESDPMSYLKALSNFSKGDAAIIFTPDDTHFEIALAAINKGINVLVTKPIVKTLEHHRLLHQAAVQNNVLLAVEVHKRWDPIYADAKDKIKSLGRFSYFYSYMSQPKHQLDTFRSWAGKSSDISYYLNSHHIDFHEWVVGDSSRPVRVTATASSGIARDQYDIDCEDTITLTVQWENIETVEGEENIRVTGYGTAVYTSSWIAPRSDVHSQQRFFYMGEKGEVNVDQAHRGYNMATDSLGYRSVNPLFMKFTPTNGKFSGQSGYGYRSFEAFIDAVASVNCGQSTIADYREALASIESTYRTTAILEAGRMSLDSKRAVGICYDGPQHCQPTRLVVI